MDANFFFFTEGETLECLNLLQSIKQSTATESLLQFKHEGKPQQPHSWYRSQINEM